jgi:hypothetical protein
VTAAKARGPQVLLLGGLVTKLSSPSARAYSSRNSTSGSIDSARCAGIQVATFPAAHRANNSAQYQRIARRSLVHDRPAPARIPDNNPAAELSASNFNGLLRADCSTSFRCAPRASSAIASRAMAPAACLLGHRLPLRRFPQTNRFPGTHSTSCNLQIGLHRTSKQNNPYPINNCSARASSL